MATYNNIKKIKIGNNIFNLYDSGNSGGTVTGVKINGTTKSPSSGIVDIGTVLTAHQTAVTSLTTSAGAHTTKSSATGAVSMLIPTKTSHLTNDSGFITTYTDEKLKLEGLTFSGSNETNPYYLIMGNSTAASARQYDNGLRYTAVNGTTSNEGYASLHVGNDSASAVAGNRTGLLILYGSTGGLSRLWTNSTGMCNIYLPNNSGTVALTSDLSDYVSKSTTTAQTIKSTLTIENHSSAIGTIKYASLSSNKSVSTNTGTLLCSMTLETGVWAITGGVRWATNASGWRRMNIHTTSGSNEMMLQTAPTSGDYTQMNMTRILSFSSNTTVYLNGMHNVSSAINALAGGNNWGTYMTAVRIA